MGIQAIIERGIDPLLVADEPVLDFLNSVCAPYGDMIDFVSTGPDYIDWLVRCQLITVVEAEDILARFTQAELDGAAKKAADLRNWMRPYVEHFAGTFLSDEARPFIAGLNARLKGVVLQPCLMPARAGEMTGASGAHSAEAGAAFSLAHTVDFKDTASLLAPILLAAADLVNRANWQHVRRCENPSCTLWFHDKSKSHKRRWCTMSVCGNRMKAAAFRARRKAEGAGE